MENISIFGTYSHFDVTGENSERKQLFLLVL
jgi:hypothetical protein